MMSMAPVSSAPAMMPPVPAMMPPVPAMMPPVSSAPAMMHAHATMPPVSSAPAMMPPVPVMMPPVPAISNQPEMSNEIEGMNISHKFQYFSCL